MDKYAVSCPRCDSPMEVRDGAPYCPRHGDVTDAHSTDGVEPTGVRRLPKRDVAENS